MRNRIERIGSLFLALCLMSLLAGCRTRTSSQILPEENGKETEEIQKNTEVEELSEEVPEIPEEPEEDTPTEDDPEAERKEYDSEADAQVVPEADHTVQVETGEDRETAAPGGTGTETGSTAADHANRTVTETVPAEEADRTGVSEDAPVAETALSYYLTLLDDRVGDLFECKRLNVYWEGLGDHESIYKQSTEHKMILEAGAYDVSAKLLQENLVVDDGWIQRKNPDVVIKTVESSVLGKGVPSTAYAKGVVESLMIREGWGGLAAVQAQRTILVSQEMLKDQARRVAAEVYFAKVMYPDQFSDIDAEEAFRLLMEESSGSAPSGTFFYVS